MAESQKRLNLRRVAIIVGTAAVVGVFLLWFFSPTLMPGQRISSVVPKRAAAAQITASAFPYVNLKNSAEFDRAAETLIAAEAARRPEPADPNDWPAAVRLALDFLRVCASGDADLYATWARESQGMAIPPYFQTYDPYTRDAYAERYQRVIGHAMPHDIRPDEYFKQYFEAYWKRGASDLRPSAVAIDPQAVEVKTQVFTHWGDSFGPTMRKDGLGPMFWIGGITTSGMTFFWPGRVLDGTEPGNAQEVLTSGTSHDALRLLREPLLLRHGSINAARIMLVYRGETGICVPVQIFAIQRPADGVWEIDGFGISNVGAEAGVGSEDLTAPIL